MLGGVGAEGAVISQMHSAVCAQRFGRLSGRGAGCRASRGSHWVCVVRARPSASVCVRRGLRGSAHRGVRCVYHCFDTRGRRGRAPRHDGRRCHRRGVFRVVNSYMGVQGTSTDRGSWRGRHRRYTTAVRTAAAHESPRPTCRDTPHASDRHRAMARAQPLARTPREILTHNAYGIYNDL